ncbi:MAG TPA: hypothetical protein VMQ11_11300 [Alphaproteobacteria bacterium]|nr:hypothetical protein [Alphaproteobacteria bacterium]
MRTTLALAAAAVLLASAPAFAGHGQTPQTEFSGPGSAGTIQQQDMERSQPKTDQNAQAPKNGTVQQPSQLDPQRDPQDPQMNPHYLHSMH